MNAQVNYVLIGERIREYRTQAGLTQAELAERAGVCQQFVGALERGKAIPSMATVLSLCLALEVDPNALLMNAARVDPEAACTLRDAPSPLTHTLTGQMLDQMPASLRAKRLTDATFPLYDIILDPSFP